MGTGTAIAAGDTITHTKMNLKLESVAGTEIDAGAKATACVFLVNSFVCPAPGTDWTPEIRGVILAANKSAKKCWIQLNFLKIGDVITTYNIVGDVVEVAGDTVTFDCKLVQVNKADPPTTTDLTNGAITQVTADGNFDSTANVDDTTVATDKQYALELNGTTSNVGGTEQIIVTGAEITINRILRPA